MPKSHTMYKENENASVKNFKRQTLQVHGVVSPNKENRKHEPKNPISTKSGTLLCHYIQSFKLTYYSVFSDTFENKLQKPRVQSRTNNETQSKLPFIIQE